MCTTSKKIFVVLATIDYKSVPLAVLDHDHIRNKVLGRIMLNISKARALFNQYSEETSKILAEQEPTELSIAKNNLNTAGFKSFKDLFEAGFWSAMGEIQQLKRELHSKQETRLAQARSIFEAELATINFFNKKVELSVACSSGKISVETVDWAPYDC